MPSDYAYVPSLSNRHPLEPNNSTDTFRPSPYAVAPVIEQYHRAWRYGHSNNFTEFLNGILSDSEPNDYVEG